MVARNQTWAGSILEEETTLAPLRRGKSTTTTPFSKNREETVVEESVVETVAPLNRQPIPWAVPFTKPVELAEPIIEEPIVEEVPEPTVTPKPSIVETRVADVTEVPVMTEPKIIEPVKTTVWPVETAQDIKAKETANKSADEALNEQKRVQATDEFTKMVESGSSIEEMAAFTNTNKQFRDSFNSVLKSHFKNSANTKFFSKYSGMTNENMLAAIQTWDIVVWSEQYNLLPEAQRSAFEQFQVETEASTITDKTDFTTANKVLSFSDILTWVSSVFSSDLRNTYREMLNTPEIKQLQSDLADKEAEIKKFDIEMEDQELNIREELSWNLPWAINAAVRDANRDSVKEKRLLLAEYSASLWKYKSLKDNAEQELDFLKYEDAQTKEQYMTALGLFETRRKEVRSDMSEEARAKAAKENAIFTAQNKLIAWDIKFERDITLLEFKAGIEAGKIKWEWVEREDWTYFERSDWTREKVLDAVTTPWISSSISFEDGQPYSEVYDINNNWVWFTSKNTSLDGKERELLNAPNGTRIPTRLNKDQLSPNNPWGKECGEYVNDIVWRSVWSKIGSTWNNKRTYANESSWGIWSVAVWQVNPSNKEMSKFWHAGIIVWESWDWKSWHIKSSNIKGQGIVSLVSVPKTVINGYKSTNIIGTEKVFNTAQKEFLDKSNVEDFANKKETKLTATSLWLSPTDFYNYKAENITSQKKQEYKTALQQINTMMDAGNWDGFSDAIWLISWERDWGSWDDWEPTFDRGTDSADFATQFRALVDVLTLPNLDLMTWTLTESDMSILRNAATWGISMNMSEKQFLKSVEDLKWALNRAVLWKKIPDGEIIFTDDDWIQYSKDTLIQEIERAVEVWDMTVEEAKQWLIDNNIKL